MLKLIDVIVPVGPGGTWQLPSQVSTPEAWGRVLIRTCRTQAAHPATPAGPGQSMPDPAAQRHRAPNPCTPLGSSRGGTHLHSQWQPQGHPCPAGPTGSLRGRWRRSHRGELQGSESQQSPERQWGG